MSDNDVVSDNEFKRYVTHEFGDFKKTMESRDDLIASVLKFHLLFENMLERFIICFLKRGDRLIDKGHLSFSQKLLLVHSFDVIGDSYIQALKHLNSLRNKLAHVKDGMITTDDVNLIGRPLGKSYTKIKLRNMGDDIFLYKILLDTFFLIHKGLVHKIASIELGADIVKNNLEKNKKTSVKERVTVSK